MCLSNPYPSVGVTISRCSHQCVCFPTCVVWVTNVSPCCRTGGHRPRALPHSRLRLCSRGSALLCEQPPGHLSHPQRQPDQHRGAHRDAQQQQQLLQQVGVTMCAGLLLFDARCSCMYCCAHLSPLLSLGMCQHPVLVKCWHIGAPDIRPCACLCTPSCITTY